MAKEPSGPFGIEATNTTSQKINNFGSNAIEPLLAGLLEGVPYANVVVPLAVAAINKSGQRDDD